ncbi:MAG: Spy/CpxP family protein refolding chaperone [Beijerinckiaceae bacterium]
MNRKSLMIGAAAVLLFGGLALAQPFGSGYGPPFMHGGRDGGGGWGPGMMGGYGPGMMGRGMMGGGWMRGGPQFAMTDPAQLDGLKKEIGITTAQEPAWTKYSKTIQEAVANMKSLWDSTTDKTPQDRNAFATQMREQARKNQDSVSAAAKELLGGLTDAQKPIAQDILPGLAFGPGPMRGAFRGGSRFQR